MGWKNLLGRFLTEVRTELRTAKNLGSFGFKDAYDASFDLWQQPAGIVFQNPKYHVAIRAYADTLEDKHIQDCCFVIFRDDYLLAMERSSIKDIEIKHILKAALTDDIDSREIYIKDIDHSYYYEGYTTFKTEELW